MVATDSGSQAHKVAHRSQGSIPQKLFAQLTANSADIADSIAEDDEVTPESQPQKPDNLFE